MAAKQITLYAVWSNTIKHVHLYIIYEILWNHYYHALYDITVIASDFCNPVLQKYKKCNRILLISKALALQASIRDKLTCEECLEELIHTWTQIIKWDMLYATDHRGRLK